MKDEAAIKIMLIYFGSGFLWILFSDKLLEGMVTSPVTFSHLQTYKGWFFVAVTSVLIYILVRHEIRERDRIDDDLKKAVIKAEQSDQLKSAFLSNMSHEIRTPLNGMLGFSELLLDDSFSIEEKKIFAKQFSSNGRDLLRLINDIMDISRIQENQLEISMKLFNLNTLLDDVYQEFLQSDLNFSRDQVQFELIKDSIDSEVQILSDPLRLTQVFQKLLQNAFFYTKEGFVKFGYQKSGNGLEFFVEDSGCGIDDSNQELLFKSFFKGKKQIIGQKGFGLGLAICRGLVKLLGSDLKFTSEVRKGTRFFFRIDNKVLFSDFQSPKNGNGELFLEEPAHINAIGGKLIHH